MSNLSYDISGGYYYLAYQYDFDAASVGQELGFSYDREVRRWVTRSPIIAQRMAEHADARARLALAGDESELRRQFANSTAIFADFHVPKPSHQRHDFRPYQKAGIAYAMERDGTLIADDMGLGKTAQAIGVMNMTPNLESALIVCPASLKHNWIVELRLWLTHQLTYCIVHPRKPFPLADICVINYDILQKFQKHLLARRWDLIVVDEFHYLKNENTRRYKQFHKIQTDKKLALSGTPYPNRPAELFTCLHWLRPDEWPSRASMRRYVGFNGKEALHLEELQQRLRATVMVRRLKKDVLTELPPKRRQIIELPSEGLRELIEREKDEFKKKEAVLLQLRHAMLEARDASDTEAYTAAAAALREKSLGTFTEMAKIRKEVALAKIPYMLPLLEDAVDGGKIVVFGHHHEVLDKIANHFGSAAVLFDGRCSLKARASAVDKFQNDTSTRVFVGGFKAAGVGITLTASWHVVFAELDWVPGTISQAEDRVHRLGQLESVLVWHTVLQDSLDATMATRLIDKQEAIERGLNHDRIQSVG